MSEVTAGMAATDTLSVEVQSGVGGKKRVETGGNVAQSVLMVACRGFAVGVGLHAGAKILAGLHNKKIFIRYRGELLHGPALHPCN